MDNTNQLFPKNENIYGDVKPQPFITWGVLNQKHDDYDALRIKKLNLLLHGDAACEPKLFMPKLRVESDNAYHDRLSFATYENNFGEIINDYGATLFEKPLSVQPAPDASDTSTPGEEPDPKSPYMEWQEHFTLDNMKMSNFMHDIQTESNAISKSYFGIDFKQREVDKILSSIPYAYYIDPCSVLDWEKDDEGNFIFIVLRDDSSVRKEIKQVRNTITTTFTVWQHKDKVTIEQYEIIYPKGKEPADDTEVYLKNTDQDLNNLDFKNIPIVECETPDNLSIGKLIGQLAGSLFSRYSTYLFCLNRGINPLLVYKQGAEMPANGDLAVMNEDDERGSMTVKQATAEGKAVIGPNDELTWESPDAAAYTVVQSQIEKDKNEMYRLCASLNSIVGHAGVSAQQTKASGIAKIIDNMGKEHMLSAYAQLTKEWVLKAFKIAFDALSKDGLSNVIWTCSGMENYTITDEDQLLAKVEALPMYKTNMPSKTSYKELLMDTAYEAHPFASIGTMNKIMQEIEDNVESQDLESVHQNINPEGAMAADGAKQLEKAVPQPKPMTK